MTCTLHLYIGFPSLESFEGLCVFQFQSIAATIEYISMPNQLKERLKDELLNYRGCLPKGGSAQILNIFQLTISLSSPQKMQNISFF